MVQKDLLINLEEEYSQLREHMKKLASMSEVFLLKSPTQIPFAHPYFSSFCATNMFKRHDLCSVISRFFDQKKEFFVRIHV